MFIESFLSQVAVPGSSVRCASAWHADGHGFNPWVMGTFFRGDWS